MAKLILQEKLILAPRKKDTEGDKYRSMAMPNSHEHYRNEVQYAYKNMDTRLYKSTKGLGFHDKVRASAKNRILNKFADHNVTPNHAHIDRELDKAMAHWNKTQKGLKMKGVTESISKKKEVATKFGYKTIEEYPDFHVLTHPDGHTLAISDNDWNHSTKVQGVDGGDNADDLHDHLMSIHPYYHGRGN